MKKAVKMFLSLSLAASMALQTVPVLGTEVQPLEGAEEAEISEEEPVSEENTKYKSVVASDKKVFGVKNGDTTLDMELFARYNSEAMNADGGSLEIVEYNNVNGYAYAVSGIKGKVIAVPVKEAAKEDNVTKLSGTEYDIKALVEELDGSFTYGDVTSVSISPDGTKLAAAVQHADYDKAGKIAVFDCENDGALTNPKLYDAGVQPDMVVFASDTIVLSADEGEPRNGYDNGAVDPKGTVTVLDLNNGSSTQVGFEDFTAENLIAKNILVGKVDGQTLEPQYDLEPEYIAVSADASKAYVALQEANAIGVLDIATKKFTDIYSAGYEDYSKVPVDIKEDEGYHPAVYENLLGARMPDGIAVYENGGNTYILTANEGDSRDWEGYCNEGANVSVAGEEIVVIDDSKCAGLPEGKSVMFGGRGFSILEVTPEGLKEVYDSGNDFEAMTAEALPDYFNCSNDKVTIDKRSPKKGPEPENVTIGTIDGRTYAFIAIERIGGIMAYDITDPQYSMCVNYINSRDFADKIQGDVSPEGICFIDGKDVTGGKPVVLAACEVSGTLAAYELTKQAADDIIVLYTNDVHNEYERSENCLGYASVAQYKKQLESIGYEVELVDNGDALQGGVIGTLSKGAYIKAIMEETGYTYAVPGNHEYDFGMDNFLNLAKDAKYEYISCNFVDLQTGKPVFEPYKIETYGGKKVAYIGITTPETFTKSTPTYFQDKNGNYIYGFCEGNDGQELYAQVQKTVNDARTAGADYVVAMGHIGTDPSSEPWTSKEIIANTTGIDAFLDGHSHSTIPSEVCKDKNGKDVLLTSTGTKMSSLGELKIHEDGTMSSALVKNISMEDTETLDFVNSITNEFKAQMNQVVANSEVDLVVNDPKTGKRLVRSQETNLGDLCADAYRSLLGADIAFVNGGGVRANIASGDITYNDIIKVHPFGNAACLIEATGQQILDALELGARSAGEGESGGFLQVSGLSYDIDTQIPSSVVLDDKKMFVSVNGTYRVRNVKVAGEPLDISKTYKLASHNYMLKSAGDGYTMFAGDKILQDEVLIDNQVLINYIVDKLNGKIEKNSIYADPYGEGRIRVIKGTKGAGCETAGEIIYWRGSELVSETVKAIGHQIVVDEGAAATCVTDGKTEGSHCAVCGKVIKEQEIIPKTGHKYETTITKATTKKNGSIVEKCTVCGEETKTIIYYPKDIKLSATSYTYNGKARKPVVTVKDSEGKTLKDGTDYKVIYQSGRKKIGNYTVTVKFDGNYTGTVKKTFTIQPKSTTVTKLAAKSKGFQVSFKKQTSKTNGYQIQYSTDKNFKGKTTKIVTISNNKTTSKSVTKLKSNKKYYVRVRTYATVKVNGKSKKIYGDWSKAKSVTTKK